MGFEIKKLDNQIRAKILDVKLINKINWYKEENQVDFTVPAEQTVKISKNKVGDRKAPFSLAITPRVMEGRYSFPWLFHFTIDPYLIMLSVKQGVIKYHFWAIGMTQPGIEPQSPGKLTTNCLVKESQNI